MSVVIVGVDNSQACSRAVSFAALRARQLEMSVCLVHVIPWSPYSFTTPGDNERRSGTKAAEVAAATEQILPPLEAAVREEGVTVESVVRHGDPVDLLIELARERAAVQIVLGRTGDSRMKRAVFGTIPGHLVQVAPVPVTVVP